VVDMFIALSAWERTKYAAKKSVVFARSPVYCVAPRPIAGGDDYYI